MTAEGRFFSAHPCSCPAPTPTHDGVHSGLPEDRLFQTLLYIAQQLVLTVGIQNPQACCAKEEDGSGRPLRSGNHSFCPCQQGLQRGYPEPCTAGRLSEQRLQGSCPLPSCTAGMLYHHSRKQVGAWWHATVKTGNTTSLSMWHAVCQTGDTAADEAAGPLATALSYEMTASTEKVTVKIAEEDVLPVHSKQQPTGAGIGKYRTQRTQCTHQS